MVKDKLKISTRTGNFFSAIILLHLNLHSMMHNGEIYPFHMIGALNYLLTQLALPALAAEHCAEAPDGTGRLLPYLLQQRVKMCTSILMAYISTARSGSMVTTSAYVLMDSVLSVTI